MPAASAADDDAAYRAAYDAFERGEQDVARMLAEAAARGGDAAAAGLAGYLAISGLGGPVDHEEGARWLRIAAEAGEVEAMLNLGKLGLSGSDLLTASETETWLSQAAIKGSHEAAGLLGFAYLTGDVLEQSDEQAARFLSQASEAGDAAAAAKFGHMIHAGGGGLAPSSERAACWFLFAAKKGDPEGMALRALALALGDGVERSFTASWAWLKARERAGISNAEDVQLAKLHAGLLGALDEDARRQAAARAADPEPGPLPACQ